MVGMRGQIVVVDDEGDIVHILAEVLREEGYEPLSYTRPEQALVQLLASPPALLITDLVMPGLSGRELIARVREAYRPDLPILVMSASVDMAAVARLPVQGFIGKPFDLDDFSRIVRELTGPERTADGECAAAGVLTRFTRGD